MISDNELVRKFLSGEQSAFDELVVRHQKRIYSTAFRMIGNAEIAEEIAQETFIRAFRSLRSFRHKASFNTWLYRITMNLCYDELKRRKKEAESGGAFAEAQCGQSADEKMAQSELRMWIERKLESLPFKQKSAVILRVFEEMSFKEVGRAIGCSTASAKVNYRHAILKLKNALNTLGEES